MAKTLSNFEPTVNIGGGITPAGGTFPVVESHDVLVGSDGKRLDTKLTELDSAIGGTGETSVATQLSQKVAKADITTGTPATSDGDTKVPSTKSVATALATKPTGTLSTAEPVAASTDTQIPTAKAVYTGLNKKINTADIASSVAATGSTSATKVPSETAVREAIEAKTIPLESSIPASDSNPSTTAAPTVAATRTAIDSAIDDASDDFDAKTAELQTAYDAFEDAVDDRITPIENRVTSLENGMIAVGTAAGMTDRSVIYIYTGSESGYTNGHWYYDSTPSGDNPTWTDGGAVGGLAIDTNLNTAGAAADAKATGDAITELSNDYVDMNVKVNNLTDAIYGYNLIGSEEGVLYQVDIKAGEYIIASFDDKIARTNSTTTLNFYTPYNTNSVVFILYLNTISNIGYRKIQMVHDIGFIKIINRSESNEIMLTIGEEYIEYTPYNKYALNRLLNNTNDKVENLYEISDESIIHKNKIIYTNSTLFDNTSIKAGTIIYYDYTSIEDGETIQALIRFYNSDNSSIQFYYNNYLTAYPNTLVNFVGRDAVSNRPERYTGEIIVPENFSKCVLAGTSNKTVTMHELRIIENDFILFNKNLIVPEYYFANNYLPSKIDHINEVLENNIAYGDAFLFITDLHLLANANKSPALIKYIYNNTSINKLFIGGDIFDGGGSRESYKVREYINTLKNGFKGDIHFVVGNHDTFQARKSSYISSMFDLYHDNYNGNSINHYYYFDNKRSKIRYIILNNYYEGSQNTGTGIQIDDEQLNWLSNEALNVMPGYGIIVFIHSIYNYLYTTTKLMQINGALKTRVLDVLDSYNINPSSNGEVICVIQGHTHVDRIIRTDGGIPIIITTCDKYNNAVTNGNKDIVMPTDNDREADTIREQAIDCFVINRQPVDNKGTINVIRIGCEAYDGIGTDDFGQACEERIVQYDSKF